MREAIAITPIRAALSPPERAQGVAEASLGRRTACAPRALARARICSRPPASRPPVRRRAAQTMKGSAVVCTVLSTLSLANAQNEVAYLGANYGSSGENSNVCPTGYSDMTLSLIHI